MRVLYKKGVATITLLQRQHETIEQAIEIAETIANITHDAAPAAKKVLEGLSELQKLLPRSSAGDEAEENGKDAKGKAAKEKKETAPAA